MGQVGAVQYALKELGDISPLLPLIVRAIVVVAALVIAWVVVSIPAYWLSRVLIETLQRLCEFLDNRYKRLLSLSSQLFEGRNRPVDAFVSTHSYQFSLAEENERLAKQIASVKTSLENFPRRLTSLDLTLNDAQKGAQQRVEDVKRIVAPEPLAPVEADEFSQIRVVRNNALFNAIVFFIASAVLITINTAMLREFWASIVPGTKILGFPLPIVASCLFSMLEVVFGVWLASVTGKTLGAAVVRTGIVLAIVSLACIEGGFYSEFSQTLQSTPFDALFNGPVPGIAKLWIGIFGPVVVFGLAGCGHMLTTAIRELNEKSIPRQWRTHLRQRQRAADKLLGTLNNIDRATTLVGSSLKEVSDAFPAVVDSVHGAEKPISEARTVFLAAIESAQAIRMTSVRQIDRAEMLRTYHGSLFQSFSAVLAACMIAIAYDPLWNSHSFIARGHWPGAFAAIAEAAVLMAAGYANSRFGSLFPVGGEQSLAVRSPRLMALAIFSTILVAIIASNGILLLRSGTIYEWMWFLLVAACIVWLFRCGENLGFLITAVWAWLQSIIHIVAAGITFCFATIVGTVRLISSFLATLLDVLAYPYRLLFTNSQTPTSPKSVTVT